MATHVQLVTTNRFSPDTWPGYEASEEDMYRIAENFRRRKLSRIGENTIFAEKTFADCSLLLCQRMPRPKILQRKLS